MKRNGNEEQIDRRAAAPVIGSGSSVSADPSKLDLARLLARIAAGEATRAADSTREEE
jgi:hypothetical protein